MYFSIVNMFRAILLVISASMLARADFEFFMAAQCNDIKKPIKCAPSAICHGFEDFCMSKDKVESCFPGDIAANDTAILERCLKPDTDLLHPTCKCACFSKFEKSYCSLFCDHVTQPTVDSVTSSSGQDRKPCDCPENSADYTWAICVIAVLAILLIGLVIGNIVFWVHQRKTPRQQNPTPGDAATGQQNPSPGDAATGQQNPTPDDAKTQGRDKSTSPLLPTDNHEGDIGKKDFQNLLAGSGGKVTGGCRRKQ